MAVEQPMQTAAGAPGDQTRIHNIGYRSYDGSWGLSGASASSAYLLRTAYWAGRFHSGG